MYSQSRAAISFRIAALILAFQVVPDHHKVGFEVLVSGIEQGRVVGSAKLFCSPLRLRWNLDPVEQPHPFPGVDVQQKRHSTQGVADTEQPSDQLLLMTVEANQYDAWCSVGSRTCWPGHRDNPGRPPCGRLWQVAPTLIRQSVQRSLATTVSARRSEVKTWLGWKPWNVLIVTLCHSTTAPWPDRSRSRCGRGRRRAHSSVRPPFGRR